MKSLYCSSTVLALVALIWANDASAHSGGTDSSGGHFNRRTGTYHHHGGGGSSVRTSAKTVPRTSYRTSAPTAYRKTSPAATAVSPSTAKSEAESRRNDRQQARERERRRQEEKRLEQEERQRAELAAKKKVEARPKAAASILKAAMTWKEKGNDELTEKWLRKVIRRYPETDAAKKARAMLGLPEPQSALRTWTDTAGTHTIQARLIGFQEGKIRLEKADGKIISLPIDKLSPADQRFVRSATVEPERE